MSHASEIQELEYIIPILDTLYEEGEDCVHPYTGKIVPDHEYDALRARLTFLHPKSTVLKDVTASKTVVLKKITHRPPMTSISKAIGSLQERKDELERWWNTVVKELGYKGSLADHVCQSYKLDGVACALYYEKGKLISAGSRRRDGLTGEDITENAKYVEGIPATLPCNFTGTIRGEIICKKSVFETVKADWQNPKYDLGTEPKNARNYSAGSIRQSNNPAITQERNLSFIAYAIISDDVKERDEVNLAKWCNKELGISYVRTTPYNFKDRAGKEWGLDVMEAFVPKLDYDVDGVVLSVRNIDDREQMGHHGGSSTNPPKGRLAWKFEEEQAKCPVKDILWRTSRTGAIPPVLQFDPIQLAGTTVTQCTGHNLGFLQRKKIGIGTVVAIIKSGQIIPKVVNVLSGFTKPSYPNNCPSCGRSTTVLLGDNQMAELMCLNVSCGARAVNTILHYLKTLGVKGLADSTIQKLYDVGYVKNPADLYKLTRDRLAKVGFSNRQSQLIVARLLMIDQPEKRDSNDLDKMIASVQGKIKVPLWQFFAALGIEGAGKTAGRELSLHFAGDFAAVRQATVYDLAKVEGIGEITAEIIRHFFLHNKDLVDRILDFLELEMPKVGKLSQVTFCLTGSFPNGKSDLEKKIEDLGGKVASSVSKKVNFVVVGVDAGSKVRKADDLGIKKLTLQDLEKML